MSFNMRDYVSDDHVESIREIAKSQSAIIQALSLENSKLETQLQQKENIIKEGREYIESYNLEYLHETNEHNLADILEELLDILDKGGIK